MPYPGKRQPCHPCPLGSYSKGVRAQTEKERVVRFKSVLRKPVQLVNFTVSKGEICNASSACLILHDLLSKVIIKTSLCFSPVRNRQAPAGLLDPAISQQRAVRRLREWKGGKIGDLTACDLFPKPSALADPYEQPRTTSKRDSGL